MRHCVTCNSEILIGEENTCAACGAGTTTSGGPLALLLGAVALVGLVVIRTRSSRAAAHVQADTALPVGDALSRALRMNNTLSDVQVRTWAADQWTKIYR